MGVKLKWYYSLLLVFLMSCSGTKKYSKNDFFIEKKTYISSYKIAFMYGCLNEATKGNFRKFLEENNDLGLFTEVEVLSHSIVAEARYLGGEYAAKIEPFDYGDGKGKVPNFADCFYYANSHEVDSIINKKYQLFLKSLEGKLMIIEEDGKK